MACSIVITWTIERICNAKYTPVLMTFINRNGVQQEHYFFLKSVESMTAKSDNFKRNIFTYSSSNYDTTSHQNQIFDAAATLVAEVLIVALVAVPEFIS